MAILCLDRLGPAPSGRRSRDDLQPYARIFGTGHTGDKDLARLNVGCELHVFRTNIDSMERALSMGSFGCCRLYLSQRRVSESAMNHFAFTFLSIGCFGGQNPH